MNSFLYRKILTPRRLMIDYQSPAICEADFTSTGTTTISLLPIQRRLGPTGLVMEWTGTKWRLRWNVVPGALCYTVYRLADVLDPFSEWFLVAECIEDTSVLLDDGVYAVTGITPTGETDPSDPIESPGGPKPPPVPPPPVPPGEDCPVEGTDYTPCDLMIPEDTTIATIVPDPTIETHTEWFSLALTDGLYQITYDGGAWKDDDNPCPGQYKLAAINYVWESGGDFDPLLGAGSFCGSQAEVEALMNSLGLPTYSFYHQTGDGVGVEYTRFGSATNPVAGSPNPTWTLKRLGTWPAFPARVRIADYTEDLWTGVDPGCSDTWNSVLAPWDGTFDVKDVTIPLSFRWLSTEVMNFNRSMKGKFLLDARIQYYLSNPHNPTGCGWLLYLLFVTDSDSVYAWRGVKSVGTSPVGRYYRESGCLTGPSCLVIEAY